MASRMQFAAPSHGAAASFRQLVHPGAVDTGSVNKSLLAEDGGRLLLRAAHTLPKTTLDSDLKDVAAGNFGPPPVTGVDAINLTSVLDASILDKYFALSGGWLPPRTFGFEPGKPQGQMSMTNAFALGKLAQLVYWDKRYITQWASQWGFADDEDHLAFVSMGDQTNSGGTQCLMLRDKNVIIIVFRGTRPVYMQDWLADLEKGADLVPVDFGGTTVNIHIGFNKLLGKVMGAVAAKLKEWKSSNGADEPELYVTGHSLGAALATLCAARLTLDPEYNDILPVYSVYTYGCPRIGDKLWKELYDSHLVLNRTTYRFVNNNDIVPRVPLDMPDGILGMYRVVAPALAPLGNLPFMRDVGNLVKKIPVPSWAADWMPVNADALTYEHVGVQYYIDRHGHVLDDIDALPRVVDGILGGGLFAPDLIIDHFMASYMRGLEFTLMGTLLSTALDKVTGITAANGKVTGVSDLKPLLEKSSHFAV